MMGYDQFDWVDNQFLGTGSPYEPAAGNFLEAHDYNVISPWNQPYSGTGMQPGEMDWNLDDNPRPPSNPSPFISGSSAEPAHHPTGTVYGARSQLNHQPASVMNGVPLPPTYGPSDAMNTHFKGHSTRSTAYKQTTLSGQAGAIVGSGKRNVSYGLRPKSRREAVDLEDNNWTYAVEVWPAYDTDTERHVVHHAHAVQQSLDKKSIAYDLTITAPVEDCHDICRRYTLPRRFRDNYRVRLDFLQVFSTNKTYNQALPSYCFKMSVVYEPRNFLPSDSYPPNLGASENGDDGDAASSRYSPTPMQDLVHFNQLRDDPTLIPPSPESPHSFLAPPTPPERFESLVHAKVEPEDPSPPRMKPIPKPAREVMKNRDGKYYCTWPNCADEMKEFNRKCEWSKHMDKHDRPYKCPSGGCEKLPGFTYSGGLLRHEREVHGKHGGPKNPLNCPHVNCKRHTGKGFSRLENLNEHLRRVHTADIPTSIAEETEDITSVATSPRVGEKRKPDDDLRDEVKRLKVENQDLRSQVEAQKRQQIAMMQQMQDLQETLQNFTNVERLQQQRLASSSPTAALKAENSTQQASRSF